MKRNPWGVYPRDRDDGQTAVAEHVQRGSALSEREKQLVELVIDGLVPCEIAARIGLTTPGVSVGLKRACVKLGAATVPQAAVKYDRMKREKNSQG
jgi:DNA-binding CsgD family transcriptional regulator